MCRKAKIADVKNVLILNEEFYIYSLKYEPQLANNKSNRIATELELKKRIVRQQNKKTDKPVFVIEKLGEIIGFVTGCINDTNSSELQNIFVRNNFTKNKAKGIKGNGKKLAKKFINWSKKCAAILIITEYYALDSRAASFYKSSLKFRTSKQKSTSMFKTRVELALG